MRFAFTPGDIVGLYQSGSASGAEAEGLIYKVSEKEIVVAFNEFGDYERLKQPLTLVKLANEITYKRQKMAIDQLANNYHSWNNKRLVEVLFEQEPPNATDDESTHDINYVNSGLNQSQCSAI